MPGVCTCAGEGGVVLGSARGAFYCQVAYVACSMYAYLSAEIAIKLFCARAPLAHAQPALKAGFMVPAWRFLHVFHRLILDLTGWQSGTNAYT